MSCAGQPIRTRARPPMNVLTTLEGRVSPTLYGQTLRARTGTVCTGSQRCAMRRSAPNRDQLLLRIGAVKKEAVSASSS